LALLAATLGIAAWAAPGAQASPTWLAPQSLLSTPVDSLVPNFFFSSQNALDVAGDRAGDAVAVWIQNDGGTCQAKWSAREAGGTWSAPASLSGAMSSCGANGTPIAVAMNASGTAVAAWQFNDPGSGGRQRIQAATRPPGGTFGAAETLSDPSSSYSVSPDVAINDAGMAAVGWEGYPTSASSGFNFNARVKPAGSSSFSPLETVAETSPNVYMPHIAIDGAGDVLAAYVQFTSIPLIEYAYRPASGSFSTATPHDLDGGVDMASGYPGQPGNFTPEIAMDAAGDATAVWPFWNGTKQLIHSAALQAGSATFGAAGAINPVDTGNSTAPQVALDPSSGLAVAAWVQCESPSSCLIHGAARPPGGSFGSPGTLSGPGNASSAAPVVAFDPSGAASVIWGGPYAGSPPDRVQVATRPAGLSQAFGAAIPISGPALTGVEDDSPAIAFDDEGNAVAVWQHSIGATPGVTIRYAALDAAPPTIGSLAVPEGVAGQPVAMSAAAFDRWSPFTLAWGFGDGQGTTGTSVSHAYAGPGSYGVTVTATDSVGNQSSAGRTVVVACPSVSRGVPSCPEGTTAPRVSFHVSFKSRPAPHGGVRFTSLAITKLTSGAGLSLLCEGGAAKGCPFSKHRVKVGKKHKLIELIGYLPHALKPKAVVEILATKSGYIGDAAELKVGKGKAKLSFLCLPVGASRPQKSCPS
jgi:hypothetical protein